MLYKEAVELCKKAGWWKDLVKKSQEPKRMPGAEYSDDISYKNGYVPADLEEVINSETWRPKEVRPVDLKYRTDKRTLKLLQSLINANQKWAAETGWLTPEDAKRRLYLHSIRRFRDDNEDPSVLTGQTLTLDIRDKDDPKFRLDDAIDHDIRWDRGDKSLYYEG